MIIYAYAIVLYMYCYFVKKFKDFWIFIACNNLFILLKEIKEDFLIFEKVVEPCQRISKEDITKVASHLLVHKYEFKVYYINA